MNPEYTIYIPSKGRAKSRLTVKALEKIGVDYFIVIEPQEFESYSKYIDAEKILVLPFSEPDSNSELVRSRNWIKKHSIEKGEIRHWQLDDNIEQFNRLNRNLHVKVTSGTIFKCAEDFVDRYENVAIAGFQYDFFAKAKTILPAFALNTRIYSCSLILNEIPFEWRGVYNDDTDICLRALKSGWCTVLFYAFIQQKSQTMKVKGGNTDIYQGEGRLKMAESLAEQHPDVAKVTWKFGRWHHHVNYKPFKKNKLIRKKGLVIPEGVNNYGMTLKTLNE
jgi:hypothetical protein